MLFSIRYFGLKFCFFFNTIFEITKKKVFKCEFMCFLMHYLQPWSVGTLYNTPIHINSNMRRFLFLFFFLTTMRHFISAQCFGLTFVLRRPFNQAVRTLRLSDSVPADLRARNGFPPHFNPLGCVILIYVRVFSSIGCIRFLLANCGISKCRRFAVTQWTYVHRSS